MLSTAILIAAAMLSAEADDTLSTATVIADRGVIVSHRDTVRCTDPLEITEVLEKIPGLYISDNGGMAGLKTVSLRGAGSPHTAIYIDGVRAGNVQSGQIDIGILGAAGLGSAVIDYAQNSLNFNTAEPVFNKGRTAGNVRFRGGSFGTYEPSGRLDFKLSDGLSMSASADASFSKGDFIYGEGLTRSNNDIRRIIGTIDLWGSGIDGKWHAKAFFNDSGRGIPGSVDWPSADRQNDRNAFIQCSASRTISNLYSFDASAKASYDNILYDGGTYTSRYGQTEFQLNSSHKFSLKPWWTASLTADFQWDGLTSTEYEASRWSLLAAAASRLHSGKFTADLALEYSLTADRGGRKWNVLSPSVGMRLLLPESISLSAFGRRAFRAPTFNELYYPGYGNTVLDPEDATTADLGAEWYRAAGKWKFSAEADIFLSFLENKIMSAPSPDNPALWMPYNVGKARTVGADVQGGAGFADRNIETGLNLKYSFQNAEDRTEDSSSFGERLPYIARNTFIADASLKFAGFSLGIAWMHQGGRRDSYGEMADRRTLDLRLGKEIAFGGSSLVLKLAARNLTDCRYELAAGYPMPGRMLYGGFEYKF